MDLSRIILGPVTTEKSERLKTERTYTLKVHPAATKVDIKNALKKFYDIEVASVRAVRVGTKQRSLGAGRTMTKRHPSKKMMITLDKNSPTLDLTKFKIS